MVFLLDASSTVRNTGYWETVVYFIADIVDRFDINQSRTLVSIILYGDRSVVDFRLNRYTDKRSLIYKIRSLDQRYRGTNNVNVAPVLTQMLTEVFTTVSLIQ